MLEQTVVELRVGKEYRAISRLRSTIGIAAVTFVRQSGRAFTFPPFVNFVKVDCKLAKILRVAASILQSALEFFAHKSFHRATKDCHKQYSIECDYGIANTSANRMKFSVCSSEHTPRSLVTLKHAIFNNDVSRSGRLRCV